MKSEIDVKQRVPLPVKISDSHVDRVDGAKMADSGYDGVHQQAVTPTTPTTPTARSKLI